MTGILDCVLISACFAGIAVVVGFIGALVLMVFEFRGWWK